LFNGRSPPCALWIIALTWPEHFVTSSDALPLSGIRVVALEQAVAAPFCSRQFADMGADVIKIERPDGGDLARGSTARSTAYRRTSPGSIAESAAWCWM